MPRSQDPRTAVIRYFITADLTDVDALFVTVREIIRSRQPVREAAPKKKKKPTPPARPLADAVGLEVAR